MRSSIIFKLLPGFLFLLLINSCKYDTDDIFDNKIDINKVPLPDLAYSLNFDNDTVYIYGTSTVKLAVYLTNKTFYGVQFYINGEPLTSGISKTNNIYSFNISLNDNQVMKVKAVMFTSTNSGSIADKLQSEAFVKETQEWTVINVSYTDRPKVKFSIEGGRLRISWDPPKTKLPVRYTINNGLYIDSTSNNWFIDSTYVGGARNYTVTCNNSLSKFDIQGTAPYPYPTLYLDNTDVYALKWDKSLFYNAITGYFILIVDNLIVQKQLNDTVFVYKDGVYGKKFNSILYLILAASKYRNVPLSINAASVSGYYPNFPLSMFHNIKYCLYPATGSNMYVWSDELGVSTLARFSVETRKYITIAAPRNSYTTHSSVSPAGTYVMYDAGNELVIRNGSTLETVKTFSTSRIIPSGVYNGSGISDIGTVVYWDNIVKSLVVYDLLNESLVCTIHFTDDHSYSAILSGNGKFLFEPWHNTLYKIENNSYTKIFSDETQSQRFRYYQFSATEPTKIALYDGSLFEVKKCDDFSAVSSIPIYEAICNMDFTSNKILGYSEGILIINSANSGQLNYFGSVVTTEAVLFDNHVCSPISQLDLNKLK